MEAELREEICEVGRRLYQRNLVAATDGNVSARLKDGTFLCTPSGVSKGFMKPSDLLIADKDGKLVSGAGKVTSEFFTHLAAYEERPDIQAVVHAHPPCATALTLAGCSMTTPVLPELVMALGGVPTAAYATPGTKEGADVIRQLIATCDAVLLERHGAVTVGKSPLSAHFKLEKVEHSAHVLHLALSLSRQIPRLGDDQLARILDARERYGLTEPVLPGIFP